MQKKEEENIRGQQARQRRERSSTIVRRMGRSRFRGRPRGRGWARKQLLAVPCSKQRLQGSFLCRVHAREKKCILLEDGKRVTHHSAGAHKCRARSACKQFCARHWMGRKGAGRLRGTDWSDWSWCAVGGSCRTIEHNETKHASWVIVGQTA